MGKGKVAVWLQADRLALLAGWRRDGEDDEEIARRIGIAVRTLGGWKQQYPEIAAALEQDGEAVNYKVEEALLAKALGGDMRAMAFWLKNKKPEGWRDNPDPAAKVGAVVVVDDI